MAKKPAPEPTQPQTGSNIMEYHVAVTVDPSASADPATLGQAITSAIAAASEALKGVASVQVTAVTAEPTQ